MLRNLIAFPTHSQMSWIVRFSQQSLMSFIVFFPLYFILFSKGPSIVLIEKQLNLQNVYPVNFSLHSGLFQIARCSTNRQKLSCTSSRPLTREIFPPNRKQTTNIRIMLCTEIHADGIYIDMRCCEFVVGGFVVLDQQSLSAAGTATQPSLTIQVIDQSK